MDRKPCGHSRTRVSRQRSILAKKSSTADDAKFDKTLTKDLSRQSRIPMSIVSVDAAQCYGRVNHVIMSLVWPALIGVVGPIKTLLHCMQTMKFFQRTGHGDSSTFTGGEGSYFMGLGQGSRGAPPSWKCLRSLIVTTYTQEAEAWCTHHRPNDWVTSPLSRHHICGRLRHILLG